MKKNLYIFFLSVNTLCFPDAVYIKRKGRMGDNLLAFIKAKWFSQKYNLPLFLSRFPYVEEFSLSKTEFFLDEGFVSQFAQEIIIDSDEIIKLDESKSTLYNCNIYSSCQEWNTFEELYAFVVNNVEFKNTLRKLFIPVKNINYITLPEDSISVAVHVRLGGGHESIEKTRMRWPLKFPPINYYINQLKHLNQLYPEKNFYIYIFTDDDHPEYIMEKFKKSFQHYGNYSFDCRKNDNAYNKNVVEDFINLSRFDCLIRPDSSFSMVAQLIGDHKIIISPLLYGWDEDTMIIREAMVAMCDHCVKFSIRSC